jgi:hypothetical protein
MEGAWGFVKNLAHKRPQAHERSGLSPERSLIARPATPKCPIAGPAVKADVLQQTSAGRANPHVKERATPPARSRLGLLEAASPRAGERRRAPVEVCRGTL